MFTDKEVVLGAMTHALGGDMLFRASKELQADKEVVLVAVAQNGRAMMWASDELQADKEVVLVAVAQDCDAFNYASKELQPDKDTLTSVIFSHLLKSKYNCLYGLNILFTPLEI